MKSQSLSKYGSNPYLVPSVIKYLYGMRNANNLGLPFKGIRTPSKTQMSDLFMRINRPK